MIGPNSSLRLVGHALGYAAAGPVFLLAGCAPRRLRSAAARLAGAAAFSAGGRRRAVAFRNLEIAFQNHLDAGEKARIVRESYRHAAACFLDFAARGTRFPKRDDHFLLTPGDDALLAAAEKEPTAFLSSHVGDWEMAHWYLHLRGLSVRVVARHIANPFLDSAIRRRREQTGASTIPKNKALGMLRGALRAGEHVGILADQNCPSRRAFYPFLGTPASTYDEFARVLVRCRCRVLFVTCIRQRGTPPFRVEVRQLSHQDWRNSPHDPATAADRLVRDYLAATEEVVRRHPEQYLWVHRRWKSRPTGSPWLYHDLGKPLDLDLLGTAQ